MRRVAIPEPLASRPFTIAEGSKAGLGEARMYGADLYRPTRSVRTVTEPTSTRDRAAATVLALPDDVAFSHTTAAELWDLPLPRESEGGRLHVIRPTTSSRVRRAGCQGHRGLESRETAVLKGLKVTGLTDTWCDLGESLGLDDLVVVGDAVARRLRDVDPLRRTLSRRNRPRGALVLREALDLVRLGAESPMESRCRLVFVRSGLPEPELNAVVQFDGGGFLCRADFVWRKQRVIAEYQGGDHFATFRRGDDDISRRLLAEDEHWKYIEMTKHDYFNPARRAALLARLAAYLNT